MAHRPASTPAPAPRARRTALPNGYTADGDPIFTRRDFALWPTGREIHAHLRHTRRAGPTEWAIAVQARRQPGHDASQPTEYRADIEWKLPF